MAATGSRAGALSASDATAASSSPHSPASSRDLGELNASRKAHSVADGGGASPSPSALTSSPFSSETEMSVHDWPMIKELSRALKHGRSGAMRQWAKVGAGVPPPSDDGSDGDDGDAHVLQHELITAFNEDKGSEKRWSGVAELLAATRVDETEAAVQQLKAQGAEPLDIAKLAPENSPLRGHELAALLDGSELKIRVRFLCKLPPWYYPHPLRSCCVCVCVWLGHIRSGTRQCLPWVLGVATWPSAQRPPCRTIPSCRWRGGLRATRFPQPTTRRHRWLWHPLEASTIYWCARVPCPGHNVSVVCALSSGVMILRVCVWSAGLVLLLAYQWRNCVKPGQGLACCCWMTCNPSWTVVCRTNSR